MKKTEKKLSKKSVWKNRIAEAANTFEWLITAFVLALFIRAFLVEGYQIPTGSMADTLMGAHFRLRCLQCGYQFEYGFNPSKYGLPENSIPYGNLRSYPARCPSCGYYQSTGGRTPVVKGDYILVLKYLYQFFEPKSWDVLVFKSPLTPKINYIKRLVALPGQTVEIIDGDVYIDGQISRKPPKVQNELWMCVYDNDYRPARPLDGSFNGHLWRQPFDFANSGWKPDDANPTVFRLDSPIDQINYINYDTETGNDFRATYAYNDIRKYHVMPYCSDLRTRFYARPASELGTIGIQMSKYQTHYKAWVDLAGKMIIAKVFENEQTILTQKSIELPITNKPALVEFTNIDHQLIFRFGDRELTFDLGTGPDDAGQRIAKIQPKVKIFGAGKIELSHINIFRDIHYMTTAGPGRGPGRAAEGKPFALGEDEFFVLGDNSANSADSRWWNAPGIGNNDASYRQGIVPRQYLVGKAFFVYWPSGFSPFAGTRFGLIPNIERLRLIYGGSGKGRE